MYAPDVDFRASAAASAPTTAAPRRLGLVDPARILASFSVVWMHSVGEPFLGTGFGLSLFFVLLVALGIASDRREPLGAVVRRKFVALGVPWIRWSVLWALLFVAYDAARGYPITRRLGWESLLYGGSRHLWFLPVALVAAIGVRALAPAWKRLRPVPTALAFAVLAAVAPALAELVLHPPPDPVTVRLWIAASPALPAGIAVGMAARIASSERRCYVLAAVSLACSIGFLLAPTDGPTLGLAGKHATATTLACAVFGFAPRVPAFFRRLATLTFAVYLLHPGIILIGRQVGALEALGPWGWAVTVWAGSALVAMGLRSAGLGWRELRTPKARGALSEARPRAPWRGPSPHPGT